MNITPLIAFAILLPAVTNKNYYIYSLPLLLFLVKDFFMGFHDLMIPVYLCVILFTFISNYFKNDFVSVIGGIFCWHIIVNFAVWWKHGGSLLQTYINAIPFDFNLLVSTGICVLIGRLCLNLYFRYSYYFYR